MKKFDLDTWEEVWVTITRNKTRSLLTAFGVFWGIFMLVALMGGASGMNDLMAHNFEGFATNSGFMGSNNTGKAYKGFRQGRQWDMENRDLERIKSSVMGVDVVTATINSWGIEAVYEENKISGTLKGQYPVYDRIEEPKIILGRTLNDVDVEQYRKVCVIGQRIYETLFPKGGNPSGSYIKIDGIYYQVVGVNAAEGNMSINGQTETSIVIPFSTMQRNYNRVTIIDMLCYTATKGYVISEVQKQVEQVVKRAHFIHPEDEQALISVNAEAMFGMMDDLFTGIRILGWLVGLGTLLAGVIGVSNIMMVTVKERTTEIGIRRAIGARPEDIMFQILSESMVLTTLAGMGGISFAVFLLNVVEQATSTLTFVPRFQISFWAAIGACVLLLILGLLSGLAPAYRAMAIKPIEAIRDE